MTVAIVPVYAAVLAVGYVWLAVRVIGARRAGRVALGTGGDMRVQRAVRAHGNFAEYVPFALILLAFAEMMGAPGWLLHLLGVALVAGRAVHAAGISREPEDFRLRIAGMSVTFGVLGLASLAILALTVA